MDNIILVIGEINKENKLIKVSYELLSQANELSKNLQNSKIHLLIIGNGFVLDDLITNLKKFNVAEVAIYDDHRLLNYNTLYYHKAALEYINEIKPTIVLIGATREGRDLAPRLSTSLNTGLTADCIKFEINSENKLCCTRPTFGGSLLATIISKKYPQMATARSNVFRISSWENLNNINIKYMNLNFEELKNPYSLIDEIYYNNDIAQNLENAQIIFAGGAGLKNKAGFERLEKIAYHLNVQIGASRGAVERKMASKDIQIGQTGKTISPKLYVAFGISGASQHVCAISSSEKIIAINKDKNAPIFNFANVGIVEDVFNIMDQLENLEKITN